MLSDEEKEALDKLSSKKSESTWNDTIRQIKREEIKDVVVTRQKYITAVLNLIEKQQKEIEELKDTRSIFNMGRRSYKNEIEDKIKAKIEEIEEMYNKLPKNPKEHLHSKTEYKIVIGELQSLLEKE